MSADSNNGNNLCVYLSSPAKRKAQHNVREKREVLLWTISLFVAYRHVELWSLHITQSHIIWKWKTGRKVHRIAREEKNNKAIKIDIIYRRRYNDRTEIGGINVHALKVNAWIWESRSIGMCVYVRPLTVPVEKDAEKSEINTLTSNIWRWCVATAPSENDTQP